MTTDTQSPRSGRPVHPHHHGGHTHLLARARIRALGARPVGPFRVTSVHAASTTGT